MFGESFFSELTKVAASIDALQAAYRRLGALRTKAHGYGGPGYMPNASQSRAGYRQRVESAARMLSSLPNVDVAAYKRDYLARPVPMGPLPGRIIMPTGGASRLFDRLGVRAGSGAAQRAVNVAAGLHEGFERRTPARSLDSPFHETFGHASPTVLANEHRMMLRATGPGTAEARGVFNHLRTARRPDHTFMVNDVMRPAFGDRGAAYYAQNGATKAMRKALTRKMNAAVAAGSSVMDPKWTTHSAPGAT